MRRALRASPRRAPRIGNLSSSYPITNTISFFFLPPLLCKLCFSSAVSSAFNHHGFILSTPFLRNKGSVFSALLKTPALRRERSSNLCHGLPYVDKRAPFSASSGLRSIQQPSSSICSHESNRSATQMEFDASVVSAICRSVISRCSHVWEKKDGVFAEGSSLLDFVKMSIGLSPQTMRRFWRVSALRPEEVLEILTGFGPKVGRKEVGFLLKLFIWSGKQTGDFRHLPKSYDMMISMLIGVRMFREAESLLLETQTCGVFVPGLNGFCSVIIQAYVEACDLKGSIALYEWAGSRPDVVLTVSCYQALLRWLVELERADLAHRIYIDMVDMGLVSNNENVALDFVVRTLCRNGKVLEAANLLRRVRDLGIESGRASLDSIADEYCKKRDFEDLLNFLKEWQHMPSIFTCNKILSCLCRTSGTDTAWLFMQSMEVLGFEADAKTFEIFICWSCREGRLRNAFMYLSELFSRIQRPDFQVYNALLSGVFKEGMWKYAKEVYADMVEKGIILDMSTFRVLLAGYCRERKFDEVTHILGEMVNLGFVCLSPSEDTLSKAFSLLGLDCLCVKVKRDNNMLFPKVEFFDSLGNGLYLDTDLYMYEKILVKILDDAVFPDFDVIVQEECRKGEMETALMMINEAAQHGQLLSFSTYTELVKGLITSGPFIKEAASVLEEIPELHNHLDHHTLNQLLQAFSKNGISVKEKLILDVLFQRELPVETDTCSAIITAFCKGGDLNAFREFWDGPQRNSWMPEFKDIRFLLSYLLNWGMLKEVFELLESMSLKYAQLIPAICNAFVKEFCTTAFTTVGYVFVEEVLQRGLVLEKSTYEHLITRLCREKKVTEAFHVLHVMLEKNVTPSASLCQILVHMLFRSSWMKKDEPLKQVNWSDELDVLFPFREALLNEVHRVGKIAKAGPDLHKLQVGGLLPFQSILDIMIQTYCRENKFRKASELLCLVIKMHLHLGISTYRDLVRLTCSIGRIHVGLNLKDLMLREYGFPPHTIYNIMIFYLFQGGNSSSMDVILDDMQQQFCSPDQISFNFLIHGYYKCGNAEKSVDLLNTMISKNLQPNNRSLRTVMCYLCNHLRLNEAMELSQTIEGKGWKHGSVTQTILVESLLSHGKLHEAEQLLGRLENKDLIPDKACYDALIKSFCRFGRVNTSVNLFNLMLKKGDLPNENSYNFVLQGFLVCNAFDEALDIHAEMLHKKIQLSMESYDMLIHGLCGNGRTGDAERVLNVMMAYGEVPTSSMFRAVLDKYHSENNLFKSSELLDKMQQHGVLPDFESHWSLISNLNSVNVTKDNNKENSGKGFLTQLLSQTGFRAKGSKTKGATTVLKSVFLP